MVALSVYYSKRCVITLQHSFVHDHRATTTCRRPQMNTKNVQGCSLAVFPVGYTMYFVNGSLQLRWAIKTKGKKTVSFLATGHILSPTFKCALGKRQLETGGLVPELHAINRMPSWQQAGMNTHFKSTLHNNQWIVFFYPLTRVMFKHHATLGRQK